MPAEDQSDEEDQDVPVDIVKCPSCFMLLRPPSICCEEGHFVCSPCSSTTTRCPTCGTTEFPNKRNTIFDTILSQICYPCVNEQDGCKAYLRFNEIDDHQKNCGYEKTPCRYQSSGCLAICRLSQKAEHEATCRFGVSCKLFLRGFDTVRERCIWRGRKSEFRDHIKSCHKSGWLPDSLQTNVVFIWMLPLQFDFEKTEMLYLDDIDDEFYFHVRCESEQNQSLAIQRIGPEEEQEQLMYEVEFKYGTKTVVFQDKIIPSEVEDVFSHSSCCSFHYQFIRDHFQAERCCDCYIRVFKKSQAQSRRQKCLHFLGTQITEERDGSVNRESFKEKIEYRLSLKCSEFESEA